MRRFKRCPLARTVRQDRAEKGRPCRRARRAVAATFRHERYRAVQAAPVARPAAPLQPTRLIGLRCPCLWTRRSLGLGRRPYTAVLRIDRLLETGPGQRPPSPRWSQDTTATAGGPRCRPHPSQRGATARARPATSMRRATPLR